MYQSTRSEQLRAAPAQAILEGLAPDGGLYTLPDFSQAAVDWQRLLGLPPFEMAAEILCALLPDFSRDEMLSLVQESYGNKFESKALTPTVQVGKDAVLELFHGPTSAFKDVALCLLPHLMRASAQKCGSTEDILILTATSGDTGKAAMSGFCDVPGVRIIVFYPEEGVSAVQKAQMLTQEGSNVKVCAVRGNFDDAQTGVKQIFHALRQQPLPLRLSSANSINIGRLAPQVVYYFSAYRAMVDAGRIRCGDALDFAVPTGNFGNILAGYIALQLGLPVGRLICASNANNVLSDFLSTGRYDRRRPFHLTLSPSMDILISSNLERLLYLLSGDALLVRGMMEELSRSGRYQAPENLLAKLQRHFWGGWCDDAATKRAIGQIWREHHYLCDTHTAVAWQVAQQYKKAVPGHHPLVVLSTASPYKFPEAVLSALELDVPASGFEAITRLQEATGVPVPRNLQGLDKRPILHRDVILREQMLDYVLEKAAEKTWSK